MHEAEVRCRAIFRNKTLAILVHPNGVRRLEADIEKLAVIELARQPRHFHGSQRGAAAPEAARSTGNGHVMAGTIMTGKPNVVHVLRLKPQIEHILLVVHVAARGNYHGAGIHLHHRAVSAGGDDARH